MNKVCTYVLRNKRLLKMNLLRLIRKLVDYRIKEREKGSKNICYCDSLDKGLREVLKK